MIFLAGGRRVAAHLAAGVLLALATAGGVARAADDPYEPNNSMAEAWDFSLGGGTWLWNYGGTLGVQMDDDWYMIDVAVGDENVLIDCTFNHGNGDIDIELVDSAGMVIAWSDSVTDNENINTLVAGPGNYYIRVYFENAGNLYDLWWDDMPPPGADDAYEPNNSAAAAWDFSMGAGQWLSAYSSAMVQGIQWNDDWYMIDVQLGYENVLIDCTFTHADGDIDIQLVDSDSRVVAWSNSATDNENINTLVAGPGTYYIRVYFENAGNMYDLWWDNLQADDSYEENDISTAPWDFSNGETQWLSNYGGELGKQWDDDWYEIFVTAGDDKVVIDCTFTHADGNIDIALWDDTTGLIVTSSTSTTDDENIDVLVPTVPGIYFIRVYGGTGGTRGNPYDLWWDDVPLPGTDDSYEVNNIQAMAWNFSFGEMWLLSDYGGEPGVQLDDDWYQIIVTAGYENVVINSTFTHADGDINIELVDSGGVVVAASMTTNDNEDIGFAVAGPGTYYIRVYGADAGNTYDLWWDDELTPGSDDPYEVNNTGPPAPVAWDFSNGETQWLSNYGGELGVQLDEDWYEIWVTSGDENVVIDCMFTHIVGNIDIELVDTGGMVVASSSTVTSNENINTLVAGPGTYYIRVYGAVAPLPLGDMGNTYDLWWDDVDMSPADDPYEQNDTMAEASDISVSEGQWLWWWGRQWDDDWYQIDVKAGSENVVLDCDTFGGGNIDIELVDSTGAVVASSNTTTPNENINTIVAGPGTYYVRVYGDDTGDWYDLWWDDEPLPGNDDPYEPNDKLAAAWDFSLGEGQLLSAYGGAPGLQWDEDWYMIDVTTANGSVVISCSFTHGAGDIDIDLYNSTGGFVATSWSNTDNEIINIAFPGPDTYYIRVYGDNMGNAYDLTWWDNVPLTAGDDLYEPNDIMADAWDFSLGEGAWLSAYGGVLGVQLDDDWYQINVRGGLQNVVIDCVFDPWDGDIDIELVDVNGVVIASSNSSTVFIDNENIDVIVDGPGTYYIRVYYSYYGYVDGGNEEYDLRWKGLPGGGGDGGSDDCGCSPRQTGTPTLGNVFGTILSWLPLMLLLLLRNRQRKGRRAA